MREMLAKRIIQFRSRQILGASSPSPRSIIAYRAIDPHSRRSPVSLRGGYRYLLGLRSLFKSHTCKESKLYQLGLSGMDLFELAQCGVNGQDSLIVVTRGKKIDRFGILDSIPILSPFFAKPTACMVNQNPSHRFGGGSKEV